MKKLKFLTLGIILTAMGAGQLHAQNLILNGDFTGNAAGFTVWPGYVGAFSTGNPTDIAGWVNYLGTPVGINGAGTVTSVFGPTDDGANTYAFLQGQGMLAQFLPITYVPNTTYQLDFDVAGRSGEAGTHFAVEIGEAGLHHSTGALIVNSDEFTHYTLTFTSPSTFDGGFGGPSIRLWNYDIAGSPTINFANLTMVVAVPEPTTSALAGLGIVLAGAGRWMRRRTA